MLTDRMPLEEWFDRYQYTVSSNIGESAISSLRGDELPAPAQDLGRIALRYGHHQGLPELREAIAAEHPGLAAEHILVTAGASEAIVLLSMALLDRGSRIVVEHPTYPTLYRVPRALGADVALFSLDVADRWAPDWSTLDTLITGTEKYVALTHPNNPTGSHLDRAQLQDALELTRRRGVRLVSDETYRQMSDAPLPPAAGLDHTAVSIGTMSKTYGLPGLRIGWIATRDTELIARLVAVREHLTITNNTLGEHISLEVLRDPDRYLELARQRVRHNKALVARHIAANPRLDWIEPDAGVVGLPWILGADQEACRRVYRHLAESLGTFVVPAGGFDLPDTFFRVGFGGDPDELSIGLDRLDTALTILDSDRQQRAEVAR